MEVLTGPTRSCSPTGTSRSSSSRSSGSSASARARSTAATPTGRSSTTSRCFWGIVIIGGTGLLLWFPEFFTRILPGWSVNVATIIHSDEALLAVGFIFTIHFFNTHFRPDKFPMDPVIFTGRVTVDELKYDKPGEYERLKASGELEEHIVEPIPSYLEQPVKVFGFTALFIGLTLIFLIIYTMLFGYR